jgi:hypothetical protein
MKIDIKVELSNLQYYTFFGPKPTQIDVIYLKILNYVCQCLYY